MNRRLFLKTALFSTAALYGARIREVSAANRKPASSTDKIDFYCHFSAMGVIDYLESAGGSKPHVFRNLFTNTPTLINPEQRLRLMDDFGVSRSVLVPLPWLETAPAVHADPKSCLEAARLL